MTVKRAKASAECISLEIFQLNTQTVQQEQGVHLPTAQGDTPSHRLCLVLQPTLATGINTRPPGGVYWDYRDIHTTGRGEKRKEGIYCSERK